MADILVKGHKCERCGYQWVPAKEQRPRTCAKCKSPYWDVPRRGVLYKPDGYEYTYSSEPMPESFLKLMKSGDLVNRSK